MLLLSILEVKHRTFERPQKELKIKIFAHYYNVWNYDRSHLT